MEKRCHFKQPVQGDSQHFKRLDHTNSLLVPNDTCTDYGFLGNCVVPGKLCRSRVSHDQNIFDVLVSIRGTFYDQPHAFARLWDVFRSSAILCLG